MEVNTHGLTLDGASVDGEVSEVSEELLCAVLRLHKAEEIWRIVDELRYYGINEYIGSKRARSISQLSRSCRK
jgi:hypothetical protein